MGDLNYTLLKFENPRVNTFIKTIIEHELQLSVKKPTPISDNTSKFITALENFDSSVIFTYHEVDDAYNLSKIFLKYLINDFP